MLMLQRIPQSGVKRFANRWGVKRERLTLYINNSQHQLSLINMQQLKHIIFHNLLNDLVKRFGQNFQNKKLFEKKKERKKRKKQESIPLIHVFRPRR